MDKQTTFEMFIRQRTKSLTDRLDAATHDKSDEAIRRLRVGIKRWRTLYRLVMKLRPPLGKPGKVERGVKRVFKRAGTVRTNQLNRQLIAPLRLPANLEKDVDRYFKKRGKKDRKRLQKAVKTLNINRLTKETRLIGHAEAVISPLRMTHQLSRLMEHEAEAISELPLTDASTEQLHTVRKHLKALIELGEVTLMLTPDKSMTRVMQRAKTLQRRLRNWHDQIVLIDRINDYVARHPAVLTPAKTRALYKRLDTRTQRQTTRIRHEVAKLSQWLPLLTPWQTVLSV
ncbi:MAG: CHAD domain-containing protein [Rudanella sp.]|nr:CHAD domain-containing protein [Rudanella sp.]